MLPKSIDTLRIDINSGKVRKSVAICQQDSVQRTLNFQLVDSGTALDMSNLLFAEILIHKADGYEADNGCVIDGDSVQYTLRTTDTSALGTNVAQLQLTFADGQVITTPTFEIEVYSKVLDQRVQTSTNEYTALTQQLVQVNELKNQTEEFKDSAETSAQTASEKAEEVVSSVEAAAQSALAAQSSANEAAQSVEQAEIAASNAAESASNASTSANSASNSASSAAASATEAREIADGIADDCQSYVTEARTYAENALESFHAAEDEATNAQTSAEAASTSATNASTSASAASTSATNAAASEDNALDYAERAEEAYRKMGKEGLVLGETDSTAYRGDRGKIAYDHSQTTGNPHATTYSDVGADQAGAAAAAYQQAAGYTDLQIANLINGAPQNLDTLKEIADAMAKSQDVVDALQAAIGTTDISAIGDGTVTGGLYQLNNDLIDGVKRFVGENFAEIGTKEGSALAKRIYGMSVQDGTPTPDNPVEIVSAKADFKVDNKNLITFPYRGNRTTVSGGITYTYDDDGTIHLNGTATSEAYFNISQSNSLKYLNDIFVASNTVRVALHADEIKDTNVKLGVYLYDKTNRLYWGASKNPNEPLLIAFTYDGGAYDHHIVFIRVPSGVTLNDFTLRPKMVFAFGNNVTEARANAIAKAKEPYVRGINTLVTTDIELRAIEVTSSDDYTYERDGKYYIADTVDWSEDEGYKITRRVERFNVNKLTVGNNAVFASITNTNWDYTKYILPKTSSIAPQVYNNYFVPTNNNGINGDDGNGKTFYNVSNHLLYIRIDEMTSQADWNTWMSNHSDMYVDLILATPTTEPITSEQAQALLSLKTYDEATSISATGDIEPSLDLEYAKSEMGAKALTGHNEAYIAQELEGVYGVKNFLDLSLRIADLPAGITTTLTEDGGIHISGQRTDSGTSDWGLNHTIKGLKKGITYKFTCNQYDVPRVGMYYVSSNITKPTTFTWTQDGDGTFTIYIAKGVTYDVTIYPMLRLASIQSDEYQPYAMSNHELTVANSAVTEKLQASDGLTFDFTKSGTSYGYKDANGNFVPFKKVQASKAVTASTSAQTVTPDSGYHGIASVTVNPTPSQSKSVTATTSAQTVSPDSGKLLSSVTVNPQVHSGTRASVTSNGTVDLGANHAIRYVPVNVTNTLNFQSKGTTYGNTTLTGLVSGDIIIGWIGWTGGENITLSNATLLYNGEMGEDMNIWRVNSNSCSTSGVPESTGIVWFRIYRS